MDPFALLTAGLNFDKGKNRRGLTAFGHAPPPAKPAHDEPEEAEEEERDDVNDLSRHHELPEIPHTNDPLEAANLLRKAFRIKVKGDGGCPAPLRSWEELPEDPHREALLEALRAEGMPDPSPIQRQALPAILADREVLAIASTGSGKTLAFLLPVMLGIRRRTHDPEHRHFIKGVKAVVLSPTRELAGQIHRVAQLIARPLQLRCSLATQSVLAAGGDLNKSDLLIATPQRLGDMVEKDKVDVSHACYLVLDEADRLFEGGFVRQIDRVIDAVGKFHTESRAKRAEAQKGEGSAKKQKKAKRGEEAAAEKPEFSSVPVIRCLFSATLPDQVEELARTVLHQPLRITVGERNTTVSTVSQRLVFVGKEEGKMMTLRQMIRDGGLMPPVLVFVDSKDRAKEVHRELMYDGVHVDSIHADQPQVARNAAVENFRSGKTWVLVATDLIGRGMDFLGVNTVINYDFPLSTSDYIHRIGRTGRAGRKGEAVTFYTESDKTRLRTVANLIKGAGGDVPDWMLHLKKGERKGRKKKLREKRAARKALMEDSGSEGEDEEDEERPAMPPPSKKKQQQPVGQKRKAPAPVREEDSEEEEERPKKKAAPLSKKKGILKVPGAKAGAAKPKGKKAKPISLDSDDE